MTRSEMRAKARGLLDTPDGTMPGSDMNWWEDLRALLTAIAADEPAAEGVDVARLRVVENHVRTGSGYLREMAVFELCNIALAAAEEIERRRG